jgi:serine/threonine protein kinase
LDSNEPDALVKITDFGLARIIGRREMMTTLCGTPSYVAPEIILSGAYRDNHQESPGYSVAVDLWSAGVILYILLSGAPPFSPERNMSLFEQIQYGLFDFPQSLFGTVSQHAKDLINALIEVDPLKRLTASAALVHPWMALDLDSSPSQPLPAAENIRRNNPLNKFNLLSPIKVPNEHAQSDTDCDTSKGMSSSSSPSSLSSSSSSSKRQRKS